MSRLEVPLWSASPTQLLLHIIDQLDRLESKMSELSTTVEALQASIAELGDRVRRRLEELNAALAAAQQQLADFTAADITEDAEFQSQITSLTDQLSSSVSDAQAAAQALQSSIDTLDQIAADPTTEVPPEEEPPVEEPPTEEPNPDDPQVIHH